MSLRQFIHITETKLVVSISFERNVSVIDLLDEISYLLDRKFILSAMNGDLVITIDVGNLYEDLKGEYLEKKPLERIKNFNEVKEKIHYFANKSCDIRLKSPVDLDFSIPLEKITFSENSIKNGDTVLEISENTKINIYFYSENYDKFDFDNLNEIKINAVTFKDVDGTEFARKFIKHYKSYCQINLTLDSMGSFDNFSELFYNSGSMVITCINLNCDWRMNLFILICHMMFLNDHQQMDDLQQTDDLLMNPMVMMKITSYLNQR